MVRRKTKIKEQIAKLQEEYDLLNTQQLQWEQAIITMTNGYTTEDLVDKIIEATNSVDKDGNPVKITKYVLKYPDTVVPVPTDVVSVQEEVQKEIETEDMCYSGTQPIHPIVTETINWNN